MASTPRLPSPIPGTGQVDFAASRAKNPGFFGGAGTGKTEQGAAKLLETCLTLGCNGMVTAPYFGMIRRAVLPTYIKLLTHDAAIPDGPPVAAAWCLDPLHPYHETKQCIEFKNGSTVWFVTSDAPLAILGANVGVAHMDEVCLIDEKAATVEDAAAFQSIKSRLRQLKPPNINQLIATGTPKGIDHWTYKLWGDPKRIDEIKESYPSWGMTIYENPHLPPDFIPDLERTFGTSSDYARQELYGEWIVSQRGRLFLESWFDRYDETPAEFMALIGSWDTAATTAEWSSFTVGQIWGVTSDFHYYLLDMFREKVEYPIVKEAIRSATQTYHLGMNIIEDKASGQMAIQELMAEGIRVDAFKPGTDKQDRANQASSAVQEGRVHIPSEQYAHTHGCKWIDDFTNEVFRAPFILSWDVVDAMSQFVIWADARRLEPERPRRLSVTARYGRPTYARAIRR